jgi:hypothetical protein
VARAQQLELVLLGKPFVKLVEENGKDSIRDGLLHGIKILREEKLLMKSFSVSSLGKRAQPTLLVMGRFL